MKEEKEKKIDLNFNYKGPEPKTDKQWGVWGIVAIATAGLAFAGIATRVGIGAILKILESDKTTQSSPKVNPTQKSKIP